ncbi:hypothetical protein BC628DRAFT_840735 [Trametes gibbosa]|nr:hypothetical protein BC628DRAFT_840735 [Trametes gibbosa]
MKRARKKTLIGIACGERTCPYSDAKARGGRVGRMCQGEDPVCTTRTACCLISSNAMRRVSPQLCLSSSIFTAKYAATMLGMNAGPRVALRRHGAVSLASPDGWSSALRCARELFDVYQMTCAMGSDGVSLACRANCDGWRPGKTVRPGSPRSHLRRGNE